ncbi:hypothetical protein O9929_10695 [Vibrio lentus]|nr:hypothetical protein [Vibrio lentus]
MVKVPYCLRVSEEVKIPIEIA